MKKCISFLKLLSQRMICSSLICVFAVGFGTYFLIKCFPMLVNFQWTRAFIQHPWSQYSIFNPGQNSSLHQCAFFLNIPNLNRNLIKSQEKFCLYILIFDLKRNTVKTCINTRM